MASRPAASAVSRQITITTLIGRGTLAESPVSKSSRGGVEYLAVYERSERLQRRFEVAVLVAALLVIPLIAIEESAPGEPWESIAQIANWGIWLTFLAELVTMLAVAPDRRAWLRAHPLDVAIVLLTPPVLPASLQAARLFRLLRLLRLVRAFVAIKALFTPEGLRYASIVTGFLILLGGTAFAAVEKDQDLTAWDGLYWAITTVTTVGYGDVQPATDGGRLIAIAVMIVGVGFVAILTAAIAERFLTASREARASELELAKELAAIRERLER